MPAKKTKTTKRSSAKKTKRRSTKKADSLGNTYLSFFLFLISFTVLATVYIAEYGYGYLPCELCIYQRMPWFVLMGYTGAALLVPFLQTGTRAIALLVFIVGGAIAGFHVGVEYAWWEGLESCGGSALPTGDISIEDVLKSIEQDTIPSCKEATWVLFDISMAGYNFIINAVLFLVVALRRRTS